MKNLKKDYIIKFKNWSSYSREVMYIVAFNESGFLGCDFERHQAKRFTYDEALQVCYEVCRHHHDIKPNQLKIIKR